MTLPTLRSLLLLILILNGADAALTYKAVCLDKIGIEVNPLMAALINISPELFIVVKVGIIGSIVACLYKIIPDNLAIRWKRVTLVSFLLISMIFLFCTGSAIVIYLRIWTGS